MSEKIVVTVNGTVYTVEIEGAPTNGAPVQVRVNGRPYTVSVGRPAEPRVEKAVEAAAPAEHVDARPEPGQGAGAAARDGEGHRITAQMPGKILSVVVKVGDTVAERDALATMEAMKMEMTIAAPVAGTVREVLVEAGQSVGYGDLLFVLE
jgi:biotin carboxyl carrier protein